MSELKKNIRKEILNKRDALTDSERKEKSSIIINKLIKSDWFDRSSMVMCFVSFGSEVDTYEFLKACLLEGKQLAVPKIVKSNEGQKEMIAVMISDIDNDLETGYFGILEPKAGKGKSVKPSEIDLIVVPGVTFDSRKYRIGYGGGFYDRFLADTGKGCLKVGVAFDLQIYPLLQVEAHDLPVDAVITESRII